MLGCLSRLELSISLWLSTRFSDSFELYYTDSTSVHKSIFMGCYGIGTTRLIGTVVEKMHDSDGMIWPLEIAPYKLHLISLFNNTNSSSVPNELFNLLIEAGIEVLYDDRDISPGFKFKDSDLIGLPYRIVVSPRGLTTGEVEVKVRLSGQVFKLPIDAFKDAVLNCRLLEILGSMGNEVGLKS